MDVCQYHLSKRRISGSRLDERILDGQRSVLSSLILWYFALGIWIHPYRCSVLVKKIQWNQYSTANYRNRFFTFSCFASLAVGRIWPYACAGIFVKVQTSCACNFDGIAIDTVIENVANAWIRVSEETIFAWAFLICAFWCLQFGTIFTINVEGLIAFVLQTDGFVKHQTISAKTFSSDSIEAFIIFVALRRMFILAAFVVRAFKVLSIWKSWTKCLLELLYWLVIKFWWLFASTQMTLRRGLEFI